MNTSRRNKKTRRKTKRFVYGGAKKNRVTLFSRDELTEHEREEEKGNLEKLLDFANSQKHLNGNPNESIYKYPIQMVMKDGTTKSNVTIADIKKLNKKPLIIGVLFPYLLRVYSELTKELATYTDKSSEGYNITKNNFLYCLQILREIYLYLNPAWYDEIYYYYYYLNLDKWFDFFGDKLSQLNDLFVEPTGKNGSKFIMNVYRSAEDDSCINCDKNNKYVVDYRTKPIGQNNIRDINHILNQMFFLKDKPNPVLESTDADLILQRLINEKNTNLTNK